jgi:hypothetical protein
MRQIVGDVAHMPHDDWVMKKAAKHTSGGANRKNKGALDESKPTIIQSAGNKTAAGLDTLCTKLDHYCQLVDGFGDVILKSAKLSLKILEHLLITALIFILLLLLFQHLLRTVSGALPGGGH